MEMTQTSLKRLTTLFGVSKLLKTHLEHAVWICTAINKDRTFLANASSHYENYLKTWQAGKKSPLSRRKWIEIAKGLAGIGNVELRTEILAVWEDDIAAATALKIQ